MGVFQGFLNVQMVPNCARHYKQNIGLLMNIILSNSFQNLSIVSPFKSIFLGFSSVFLQNLDSPLPLPPIHITCLKLIFSKNRF